MTVCMHMLACVCACVRVLLAEARGMLGLNWCRAGQQMAHLQALRIPVGSAKQEQVLEKVGSELWALVAAGDPWPAGEEKMERVGNGRERKPVSCWRMRSERRCDGERQDNIRHTEKWVRNRRVLWLEELTYIYFLRLHNMKNYMKKYFYK